jgi:hypothetical protein
MVEMAGDAALSFFELIPEAKRLSPTCRSARSSVFVR